MSRVHSWTERQVYVGGGALPGRRDLFGKHSVVTWRMESAEQTKMEIDEDTVLLRCRDKKGRQTERLALCPHRPTLFCLHVGQSIAAHQPSSAPPNEQPGHGRGEDPCSPEGRPVDPGATSRKSLADPSSLHVTVGKPIVGCDGPYHFSNALCPPGILAITSPHPDVSPVSF